ncbi:MAG: nucleoside hydrolase [Pseudomonadales bacterium]
MKFSIRVLVLVAACLRFQGAFAADSPTRIWIDTDAACGAGLLKDVDDCLAIAMLLENPKWDVVGISTVFGNAAITATDRIVRRLVEARCGNCVPVYRGAKQPGNESTHAVEALVAALETGPLVVFVFGPATNVSAALQSSNAVIEGHRFVAVAGTRERRTRFRISRYSPFRLRDLNFASDPGAFEFLLSKATNLSLVPFELAQQVRFRARHIDKLADHFPRLARQSRRWLWIWRLLFGSNQFHPFDAVALGLLFPDQSGLICSPGRAAVVDYSPLARKPRPILHVLLDSTEPNVSYCHEIAIDYVDTLLERLPNLSKQAN